ncbi:MAG TPA: TonB-dependent receptor, partial [Ferruginibacter sp.]|nr:TonB-dependent receptor [Ferruginibacter sp.]
MRKKSIAAILPILLLSFQVQAQTPGSVKGSVTDSKKSAMPSVTVSLLHAADSSLVKTELTDAQGLFEIPVIKSGKYLLGYSLAGHEKTFSNSFEVADGQSVKIPEVQMQPQVTKLQGVVVTSKKPLIEVKADKTVFNVENSINATGSNAMELLQKSPGVLVDNNDNISMKGKTGVRIYVDGKMMQLDSKDLAAYLRSITSSDIESIEMISNPSAKYDASGNAGIINIKLKKNKKYGTNGSVNAGFTQGITPKGNGSLNLNYRNKKVNLFGNIGGNIGRFQNELYFYRKQKDTVYDQKTRMYTDNQSINAKVGADFFVNSKHTLGVMTNLNYNDNQWNSEGNTDIYEQNSGVFVKSLKAFNTIPGHRLNSNSNLNYRYADTSGREVNVDIDYGIFRGRGRSYQPNFYNDKNNNLLYSIINRNNTPTDINIFSVKADAEQRLGKGKLGYGVKGSFVTTKNSFEFFNDDANGNPIKLPERSNRFKYKEHVYAAYLNYQRQLNEKWSLQAGLRAEQTNSEGILTRDDGIVQSDNEVKREYLDFFPSAALSWNLSQK